MMVGLGSLFAILALTMIVGGFHIQQKSTYLLPELQYQTLNEDSYISILNRGGDTVSLNASSSGQNLISVYVDTMTGSYRALPVAGLNQFKTGNTIFVYYNATVKGYKITNNVNAMPGTSFAICPVTVRLVDENAKIIVSKWQRTCDNITGPGPTVTSMNSTTGYRGWPMVRNITGTYFLSGATALLNRSDGEEIPATSCTCLSPTSLICTFDLTGKAISLPRYNVVVTNPDGKRAMRANYFTLSSPAPTLTSSAPSSGLQGATVTITLLRGTYFQPGAVVVYNNGTTTIPLTGVTVTNPSSISGTLTIPAGATIGYYNITVTNPDAKTVTRANLFRVLDNAPTVSGITNRTGYSGWQAFENITGTNFVSGSTASFVNGTLTINPVSCTYVSSTRLFCTYDLTGVEASATNGYSVLVSNPDGKTASRANYFTVSNPTPVISSSTPSTGVSGNLVTIVSLSGTYFQPGATVTYWQGSTTSLPLGSISVPVMTRITGMLDLSSAPTGYYNITVKNPLPVGKTTTRTNAFRVYAYAAPTLSGISPIHGQRGTTITPVLVTGANFRTGAQVRLYNGSTLIYTAPVGSSTATQITTTFALPVGVIPNVSNVRVTNPDGQYAILTKAYTIEP